MPENINKFCLICQSNNCLDFIDVFSENGIKLNISQIIYKHFGIQVNENHLQSVEIDQSDQQFVCTECWLITESFHNLFEKVQEFSIALPSVIKEINEENLICVVNVKKEENQYDDTAIVSVVECNNDNNFTSIKAEPIDSNSSSITRYKKNAYFKEIETVVIETNIINDDDVVKDEETYSTKLKPKRNSKKRIQRSKIKNNTKQTKQYSVSDTEGEDNDDIEDSGDNIFDDINEEIDDNDDSEQSEEYHENHKKSKSRKCSNKKLKQKKLLPKRKTKSPEEIEKENQQIRDFFQMTCELCETLFLTFTDAQNHYLQKHNQIGYLICCKKKFVRPGRITDHINRHLNPDAYKCSKCNKIYADKIALRNHMENHTPIDKREYKCDICTSSFTKLFKLSQHMRITHCTPSDEKLQCPECDKSFVTKTKLNSHIKGVHELAHAHICHICARTFKTKQVYELHQRQHSNVATPKLQCKICGAWLKHEHSLKDHVSRHSEGTATCGICNKVKPNKKALDHHIRSVHSERTHQCTMCEKAFKKAIGLKEHMASHTGVDLYTCPYCPKTFKSGANMHSHRKKVHPIEWQSDRIKRQKT